MSEETGEDGTEEKQQLDGEPLDIHTILKSSVFPVLPVSRGYHSMIRQMADSRVSYQEMTAISLSVITSWFH